MRQIGERVETLTFNIIQKFSRVDVTLNTEYDKNFLKRSH